MRQECGVGIIEIDVSQDNELAFCAPPTLIRSMDADQLEAIVNTLEIPREERV